MQKIARRHNFCVLLHEKPFAGVNGSGKAQQLVDGNKHRKKFIVAGKNAENKFAVPYIFVNTIKAFHDNADLLRATIASAGNDSSSRSERSPPAIMSVFLGSQLTAC